jgi:hypothetical protein
MGIGMMRRRGWRSRRFEGEGGFRCIYIMEGSSDEGCM